MRRLATLAQALAVCAVLVGACPAQAALVRKPYLQLGTPTSITVVWRTTDATDSRVRYGTDASNLAAQATSAAVGNDHVVTVTGLTPATKYFYDVGSATEVQGGGTTEHYFITAPTPGNAAPFTAWIVGDSGDGDTAQADVRDAMLAATGADPPDVFLHMGDMAYNDGTDAEFTDNFFGVYADILRHTTSWPTLGNHEESTSSSSGQTGPYFDAYVLPKGAEAGGVASGTEAYYAFDYANVHFIVLDTADSSLAPSSAMLDWLIDDLSATAQEWIVAYFHHPPYSKGSHDSDDAGDSNGRLIAVRENVVPLLEAGGTDLVLAGHSHAYERSFLIDGVHCPTCGPAPGFATPGFATLASGGHILDTGDGDPAGDGAYGKPTGLTSNNGAVYVVAGHGGRSLGLSGIHPVMKFAEAKYGSCLLTVDDQTLTLRNLRRDGVVTDTFSIVKEPPLPCSTNADCDDGNSCTDETCDGGTCVRGGVLDCDDQNPCTDDACDIGGGCTHEPNAVPCSDGNECTYSDVCNGGSCISGGLLDCNDGDDCTDDGCDSIDGCVYTQNAAPCDDGDACTTGDTCNEGICVGGPAFDCDDGDPCTDDACGGLGACAHTANTAACDDGDACTTGDTCSQGVCTGGGAPDCNDGNPCTDDSCNVITGCEHAANAATCDDGDPCTTGDTCSQGICSATSALDCDDGDPCTDDICDGSGSCDHTDNFAPCDDGDACTVGDVCSAGVCLGGEPNHCDDGNSCTDDSCDASSGCEHAPNAGPCNDGDACTTGDTCSGGSCVGSTALDCNDGNTCTDDACTGAGSCEYTDNFAPCDDGDPCTTGDVCIGGGCVAGDPVSCDDGNPCTDDACGAGGGCEHTPNALVCDDGNACTLGDVCSAGSCIGTTPLDCDDGNPCTDEACDAGDGCSNPPNSAACDDGNACTLGDTCSAGSCIGATSACDDDNPCTDDACDVANGCSNLPNSGACDDGDACTLGDVCSAGSCIGTSPRICDDENPCTDDACSALDGCVHAPNVVSCDDGNACTTGDVCSGGVCSSTGGTDCNDGNPCTDDACDAGGGCVNEANASACDDGDACTLGDVCSAGSCIGTAPRICDDGNPCTDDACSTLDGCVHAINTAPCDDGNACTTGDVCSGGVCSSTGGTDCNDDNPCTDDACDAGGGCINESNANACDDGNACTLGDVCSAGSCIGTAPRICDDGNPCTDDACSTLDGCVYAINTAPCDDGNACTTGDVCSGGACSATAGTDCNDGNPCTDDACDAGGGCINAANASACDDGDACTIDDICFEGACAAGAPAACEDGNPCTEDVCDASLGCTNTPSAGTCDDGDACTEEDLCIDGACFGQSPIDCDDGNPCTDDTCDGLGGCANTPNLSPCDDGDACTLTSTCSEGICFGSGSTPCDDGNPCTDDLCDQLDGCAYTPNLAPCDDGDICTTGDSCSGGGCVGGLPLSCDDQDDCTRDTCDAQAGCTYTDLCWGTVSGVDETTIVSVCEEEPGDTIVVPAVTVGKQPKAALIVTVGGEENDGDCDLAGAGVSVLYGDLPMTAAVTSVSDVDGWRACNAIFYMLRPPQGTADVTVSFANASASPINNRQAGAFVAYNIADDAPMAIATSGADPGSSPTSTTISPVAVETLVVDVVTDGEPGLFATTMDGQIERWQGSCGSSVSAASTRLATTAGSLEMGWTHSAPRRHTHALAGFACVVQPTSTTTTTTLPGCAEGDPGCNDPVCPPGALGEVDVIDFEGRAAGAAIGAIFARGGAGPVVVSGFNPRLADGDDAAIVFDSSCPGDQCSGKDFDLGTPHRKFGGPGRGGGGAPGSPFENVLARGRMAIVGEDLLDLDGDGLVDDPDDQGDRDVTLTFDFAAVAPVVAGEITLVDTEDAAEGATVDLLASDLTLIRSFAVPDTGNNGVAVVDLQATPGVHILRVSLTGSGAVDDLVFTPPCDPAGVSPSGS